MTRRAAVIGGGPAGLMAAEALLDAGITVDLYDAMPSLGRKFLMAGKGGLNITHSEPVDAFIQRYGAESAWVSSWLTHLTPDRLRSWIEALGITTFIGTSGRVFPHEMKAAPLLRAWLQRLRQKGLRIHVRHRWLGFAADLGLRFATPAGEITVTADATILALGGGSWPQLGSDGTWQGILAAGGVEIAPLQPANCGFEIAWSDHFRARFAGAPVKNIAASIDGARRSGEAMLTEHGIEGGLIYALSAPLREAIAKEGAAILTLDLLPNHALDKVQHALAQPRGSRSLSSFLKSQLRLDSAKVALLREAVSADTLNDPTQLAAALKSLPLRLTAPRPIAEAISSAGGVTRGTVTDDLMLKNLPGIFCAGEMLDWEAPTGGYLLSACFASGLIAGRGAADRLNGDTASNR